MNKAGKNDGVSVRTMKMSCLSNLWSEQDG